MNEDIPDELREYVEKFFKKHEEKIHEEKINEVLGDMKVFEPFDPGHATRDADGKTVTGTVPLKPGYRLLSVEVFEETFLTMRFEVDDGHGEVLPHRSPDGE